MPSMVCSSGRAPGCHALAFHPILWMHNCCFPFLERMKANSSYSAATGYEPNRECLTPRRGESCRSSNKWHLC